MEDVEVAAVDFVGDDAGCLPVGREQQIEHVEFIKEAHVAGDALLIECLQDHVAGAVGGVTGTAYGFFAEVTGMAAERTLGDLAFGGAVEGQTHVFQFIDYVHRLLAHEIDPCVLVGEIVAAFDCVKSVPFGAVFFEVAEGGADASLRGACMAAGGIEFGQDGCVAALAGIKGCHQTGAAGAHNDRFKFMRMDHLVPMLRSDETFGAKSAFCEVSERLRSAHQALKQISQAAGAQNNRNSSEQNQKKTEAEYSRG